MIRIIVMIIQLQQIDPNRVPLVACSRGFCLADEKTPASRAVSENVYNISSSEWLADQAQDSKAERT